ncbi:MAG TPA: ATP-binding protein [Thermomicrobiales bacterium]|nr:ATP-binding protein [Thermomicrobiales bacterium]
MPAETLRNRTTAIGERLTALASLPRSTRTPPRTYLLTALALAPVTLGMVVLRSHLGVVNIAMIYLLIVLLAALWAGRGPAVLSAVATFVLFDFFFLPPYHTFTITASDHVLALFVFLAVALVTSRLVARVRDRVTVAEQEKARAQLLYQLNEGLVTGRSIDEILNTIAGHVVGVYGAHQASILTWDAGDHLDRVASAPAGAFPPLTRNEEAVALRALRSGQATGIATGRTRIMSPHGVGQQGSAVAGSREDVLYLPIDTPERKIGVLEVRGRPDGGRFDDDDRALLGSLADQAALALERVRLTNEAARAEVLAQSDELKSALLASVSHDLRTPLATIKTSVSSLMDPGVDWSPDARNEFLEAIDEETDRLTRMVGNLLDLSRIEGGALRPDRDWYDARELVQRVVGRLAARAAATGHTVAAQIDPSVTLGLFDFVEIDQVLANLIENAIKYTPEGSSILVETASIPDGLLFTVRDDGPGIPSPFREKVFEKFYRAGNARGLQGTGIGLTISRGLVEAHGGRIWIESGANGAGTSVRFTIPFDRSSLRAEAPV